MSTRVCRWAKPTRSVCPATWVKPGLETRRCTRSGRAGMRVIGAGELHAVQSTAQRRRHRGGQGPDEDVVVDDVCQVAVQRGVTGDRPGAGRR
jgi:hypothetical protein